VGTIQCDLSAAASRTEKEEGLLRLKHALDFVLAFALLVLLSPFLGAVAIWILVESGRPVLLHQLRAGKDGKPFRMVKFRTMVADAIEAAEKLGLKDPYGIIANDPRVTRSGRFLRRTGLDELPQLWNVLRGEMSIVGPRPDLVEQAGRYSTEDRKRLTMRPGITGWSQIQGRAEIPWPVRFRHDAWYVDHWSLGLDARIVLRTFVQMGRPEPNPVEDRMNIQRARSEHRPAVEVPLAEWDAVLGELGIQDVYFLRDYVAAACMLDGGRPTLLHAEDSVFACSVRPIPGSEREDVTSPYGYGGPVGSRTRDFWPGYERWCAERAVVSTFVRFHPLYANHLDAPPSVRLERLADTTSWPLDRSAGLFESMHRHHRRAVRKAEQRVAVRVSEAPDDLGAFIGLYEDTMVRVGADDFYFFPRDYWDALASRLGDHLVLFDAVDDAGVAASILCLATPPWLHYHLGGSTDRARAAGASNLLMLEAARWGRRHAFTEFHLGGGVGGSQDSLWQYKRRYAPTGARELWIGKLVHDEHAYAELSGTDRAESWFPAYRRRSASVQKLPAL
jgi:lipopolysaccharide/colanic/teichoic acid biosynthesis glycosyltransferase